MTIQQIASYSSNNVKYTNNGQNKAREDISAPDAGQAAVYEPAAGTEKVYKRDQATIDRLLAEAETSARKMRELVERMLLKQGKTLKNAEDIYGLLREGKVPVDEATRLQAQKDIAEDGYWGVEQTSERLVSFAKALSGGDPAKADIMIDAVKKGFEQATKAWGGELPQICRDTVDRTISKLESWRDSIRQ
ncbi:MAG: hypothetical protein GX059_04425 [Clostridiales bacterium]|jgi:hypothetical protein|nr:hypothetical protein [Clostridiales bacterium]